MQKREFNKSEIQTVPMILDTGDILKANSIVQESTRTINLVQPSVSLSLSPSILPLNMPENGEG